MRLRICVAGRGQYIDRQKAVDMSKTGILCVDIGLNFNCSMMVVPRAGVIAILKQGPVESLSLFGTGRVLNATRTLAGILASPDHDTTTPRHHDATTPRTQPGLPCTSIPISRPERPEAMEPIAVEAYALHSKALIPKSLHPLIPKP